MAQRVYSGTLCKGDGGYGMVFVDFPGCVSAGDDVQATIIAAHEALQGHVDAMVVDGDDVPEPTEVTIECTARAFDDAEDLDDSDEWVSVVPIVVDVPDRLETLAVPVSTALLADIARVGANNQQFIEEAIRRQLDQRRGEAA